MGNSIKGAKFLRNKQEEFVKTEFDKYLKLTALKEKKEVINALMKAAKGGNVPALKELFDRLMGKAVSPIELSGKEGQPFIIGGIALSLHRKKHNLSASGIAQ